MVCQVNNRNQEGPQLAAKLPGLHLIVVFRNKGSSQVALNDTECSPEGDAELSVTSGQWNPAPLSNLKGRLQVSHALPTAIN